MLGRTRLQALILNWALNVFGSVARDPKERAIRFMEEAMEAVHTQDVPRDMIDSLANRVWSRDKGDPRQEIGQALLTLKSLAQVLKMDADSAANDEWNQCRAMSPSFYQDKYEKKIAAGLTVHALGWREDNAG